MYLIILLSLLLSSLPVSQEKPKRWGFTGHLYITDHAVAALPLEMLGFYKKNRDYLREQSVVPDKRRHTDPSEAPRHYIDIELFKEAAIDSIPKNWKDAVEKYSEDSLQSFGIVPWQINKVSYFLTKAFEERNYKEALRLSAELSHYIADAHVPLHTTENYNGQLTGQKGIHALWETHVLEKYINSYPVPPYTARYIANRQTPIWSSVKESHALVSEVFAAELEVTKAIGTQKYAISKKGKQRRKTYSAAFVAAYHDRIGSQVKDRYLASIRQVANFWYSAWVDAGRPDLPKRRFF